MRLKRILYPLICIAVVFAIATFLIVKNRFNDNPTAQTETSVKTGDAYPNKTNDDSNKTNDDSNKTNDDSNKTNDDSNKTNDDSNNEDDGTQTLIEDPDDKPDDNPADDNTNDNDDDNTGEEDNTTGGGTSDTPTNPSEDEPADDDTIIEPENPISPVEDSVKIVLADCDSNTIVVSTDILCLNYEIVDGNKQYVNQDVNIIIENENVCDIMLQGAPLIYLQKQGKGKTTVKIVSVTNPKIFKIITVIFN